VILGKAVSVADAHDLEARIRVQAPVHQVQTLTGATVWLITRYSDARVALVDPRLSKSITGGPFEPFMSHMLNSDPPRHTRLRAVLSAAFTARRVATLRPRIEEVTAELLDDLHRRDEADLVEDFAAPLPITVIGELLGVPTHRRADLRAWTAALTTGTRGQDYTNAGRSMVDYVTALIETKRSDPTEDLLSDLIAASGPTGRLSEQELLSTALLMITAGHETTVNLISNGVLTLLRHPEHCAALRADPSGIPSTVDEFLRFDSPMRYASPRVSTEALTIGDTVIPAGEVVLIGLSSSNRDPDRFPDPDRFDPDRSVTGHLAFGHGIHHCLGAPLARLQAQIAIGGLLDRFAALRLAADPNTLTYRPSLLLHGLLSLPVRLR
jgi:cytochrome P450